MGNKTSFLDAIAANRKHKKVSGKRMYLVDFGVAESVEFKTPVDIEVEGINVNGLSVKFDDGSIVYIDNVSNLTLPGKVTKGTPLFKTKPNSQVYLRELDLLSSKYKSDGSLIEYHPDMQPRVGVSSIEQLEAAGLTTPPLRQSVADVGKGVTAMISHRNVGGYSVSSRTADAIAYCEQLNVIKMFPGVRAITEHPRAPACFPVHANSWHAGIDLGEDFALRASGKDPEIICPFPVKVISDPKSKFGTTTIVLPEGKYNMLVLHGKVLKTGDVAAGIPILRMAGYGASGPHTYINHYHVELHVPKGGSKDCMDVTLGLMLYLCKSGMPIKNQGPLKNKYFLDICNDFGVKPIYK